MSALTNHLTYVTFFISDLKIAVSSLLGNHYDSKYSIPSRGRWNKAEIKLTSSLIPEISFISEVEARGRAMFLSMDTGVYLIFLLPIIIFGFFSNASVLFLIFKKIGKSTILTLLTLPLFLCGLFTSILLLPLAIINSVFLEPSISSAVIILQYIYCEVFMMTIISIILLKFGCLISPTLLSRFSRKNIMFAFLGLNILVTLGFLIKLLLTTDSIILTPILMREPTKFSALRLSIFTGVGIFLTLLLVALQMLIDGVSSKWQINFYG